MSTCVEPELVQDLKNHVLEQVLDTEKFQAFRMKDPGQGRIMSTLITFTPEGIVIQGDLAPGRNGNVSCGGYGLGWFRGRLSEDYLASKFLEKGWYAEVAATWLRRHLKDIADGAETAKPGDVEKIRKLASRCNDGDLYIERFRDYWEEIYEDWDWDSTPGWGYKPSEHAWLCVIQRKFAELYNAKELQEQQRVSGQGKHMEGVREFCWSGKKDGRKIALIRPDGTSWIASDITPEEADTALRPVLDTAAKLFKKVSDVRNDIQKLRDSIS